MCFLEKCDRISNKMCSLTCHTWCNLPSLHFILKIHTKCFPLISNSPCQLHFLFVFLLFISFLQAIKMQRICVLINRLRNLVAINKHEKKKKQPNPVNHSVMAKCTELFTKKLFNSRKCLFDTYACNPYCLQIVALYK